MRESFTVDSVFGIRLEMIVQENGAAVKDSLFGEEEFTGWAGYLGLKGRAR